MNASRNVCTTDTQTFAILISSSDELSGLIPILHAGASMSKDSNEPTFRAYTIVKREGQKDFWLNIGAAFSHQNGGGLTVALQALPIDGRIVLRQPKSETE